MRSLVGIDLGATKTRAVLARLEDSELVLAHEVREPTSQSPNVDEFLDQLGGSVQRLLDGSRAPLTEIEGIGVSSFGPFTSDRMSIKDPPNVAVKGVVPLGSYLQNRFGKRVVVGNDGDLAAVAENQFGRHRSADITLDHPCGSLIYLTVSSGIGGGLAINGEMYRGSNPSPMEVGHMLIQVPSYFGQYGLSRKCGCTRNRNGSGDSGLCVEAIASGNSIAELARAIVAQNRTQYWEGRDIGGITTADVFQAYRNRDPAGSLVVEGAATALGTLVGNLWSILGPYNIYFGGGVSKEGESFLDMVRAAINVLQTNVGKIYLSGVGYDIGALAPFAPFLDPTRTYSHRSLLDGNV